MSVITRYIDVNSRYRNRTQHTNPAQFQLQFDGVASSSALVASDPVCDAAPTIRLHTAFNTKTPYDNILSGTVDLVSGGNLVIYGSFDSVGGGPVPNIAIDNFYAGAVIRFTGATLSQRRIIKSTYFNTVGTIVKMRFVIDKLLPDATVNGAAFSIQNAAYNDGAYGFSQVFIPTGVNIDNYYVGWYLGLLNNSSAVEVRQSISAYDGTTRMATVPTSYSNFLSGGNEIVIRRDYPTRYGDFFNVDGAYNPAAYLNSTTQITLNGLVPEATVGSFVRIIKFPTDGDTVPSIHTVAIRRINTSITRDIEVSLGPPIPSTVIGFSAISFTPNGGVNNDQYELLPFSYDNSQPISFSGNIQNNSDVVCYELRLINLLLPNVELLNGRGGRFSSYPYVWVEFIGSTANIRDPIWSNARNSTLMLFKVPIKDINNPTTASFIKLDSNGMNQFIPFKPVDTFTFTLRLPDGTIPSFLADTSSPVPPDDRIQISATFEIRKRS